MPAVPCRAVPCSQRYPAAGTCRVVRYGTGREGTAQKWRGCGTGQRAVNTSGSGNMASNEREQMTANTTPPLLYRQIGPRSTPRESATQKSNWGDGVPIRPRMCADFARPTLRIPTNPLNGRYLLSLVFLSLSLYTPCTMRKNGL